MNYNKKICPPKILKWSMERILPDFDSYFLIGDYEEEYADRYIGYGKKKADLWYFKQIIINFPNFFISSNRRSILMFKNYLKMAYRNIIKQKAYSFINLFGLSVGMACCTLILLFIEDELSFDKYHENSDNIYRIITESVIGGKERDFAIAPGPLAPALKKEFPEVLEYVRIFDMQIQNQGKTLIKYKESQFEDSGLLFTDSTFFSIFSHSFISGDKNTALRKPNSIVITEETANKIFSDEDPIGKIINIGTSGISLDAEVTGVIKNVPKNSHFHFKYITAAQILPDRFKQAFMSSWLGVTNYTYILSTDNLVMSEFNKKMGDLVIEKSGKQAETYGISMVPKLQKLTDIHLTSNLEFEAEANSEKVYIYIFSGIAVFILLIACINFMNLSTARSSKRAKEVGLRKVFGAYKKQLVGQFLSESILISFLGFVISFVIVSISLPYFNEISGKTISSIAMFEGKIFYWLAGMMLITGLLAGSYPAMFLSSFKPVKVLKGALSGGVKGSGLRSSLVVFQFSISIILIISTMIVLDQLNFMRDKNLGFDKEQILVIKVQDLAKTPAKWRMVRNELKSIANVENASFSSSIPGRKHGTTIFLPEGNKQSETLIMDMVMTDYDFVDTYGIEMADGRDFSESFASDSAEGFLINETAAKLLGYSDSAVGKKFQMGVEGTGFFRKGKIVGIMKDFHTKSVKQKIEPFVVILLPQFTANVSLKIKSKNVSGTINLLKEVWSTIEPGREFNYFFLDDDFDKNYRAEERLGKIFTLFAGLAVLIACLGLYGLASFITEQRTKEIGIRKVLGASTNSIITSLSKDFTKWVLLANLIAWPITYYIMDNFWLVNFPYKENINLSTFVTAFVLSIFISIITVSYQSIKAALSNPIESLRYE